MSEETREEDKDDTCTRKEFDVEAEISDVKGDTLCFKKVPGENDNWYRRLFNTIGQIKLPEGTLKDISFAEGDFVKIKITVDLEPLKEDEDEENIEEYQEDDNI